eukprot:SAG22_NODE_12015_length_459_cov_1.297222_1_plen_116_part_10
MLSDYTLARLPAEPRRAASVCRWRGGGSESAHAVDPARVAEDASLHHILPALARDDTAVAVDYHQHWDAPDTVRLAQLILARPVSVAEGRYFLVSSVPSRQKAVPTNRESIVTYSS